MLHYFFSFNLQSYSPEKGDPQIQKLYSSSPANVKYLKLIYYKELLMVQSMDIVTLYLDAYIYPHFGRPFINDAILLASCILLWSISQQNQFFVRHRGLHFNFFTSIKYSSLSFFSKERWIPEVNFFFIKVKAHIYTSNITSYYNVLGLVFIPQSGDLSSLNIVFSKFNQYNLDVVVR